MEGDQRPNEGGNGPAPEANPVGAPTPPPAPAPAPYPPPPAAPAPYTPPPPQYGPPPQQPPYQPAPPPYQPAQPPPQAPYQPPPSYAPPGYAAPGAPATYAPPQPGYQQPMQPGFAPPPAKGGSRTLLIVGVIAILLIVLLAAGGLIANASLSSTYSPARAVSDYLSAQSRGDVGYMVANANYLKGDSGTDAFFGRDALTSMMQISDNKAVSNVKVTGTEQVDSSTSKVSVSMTWSGNDRTQTYTVHKDTSRPHFVLYSSWLVDIPASTISVTLPNQAGAVTIDGISAAAGSSISVIQGFHSVAMQATDLYDVDTQAVNAVESTGSATFSGKWKASTTALAAAAVKASFANFTCDAAKYFDCPNHNYKVPAGYYDTLPLPGGDVRANSSWAFTFTGDPTANMKLVVTTTQGKVTASGTCSMKLVVDGKTTLNYTGTWDGTLTFSGGNFASDVLAGCDDNKA
jgi:hypothetical protein